MLFPLSSRPVASVGLESMAPPGAKTREPLDQVVLGRPPAPEPPSPGLRGWRKVALIGLGCLSLGGAVSLMGPTAGPALVVAQATPQEQIRGMIVGGASAQEKAALVKALEPVPPEVVSLLSRHGLSMQVVRPGQDLAETGVLRPVSPESYRARESEIRSFMSRLWQECEARFDGPLRAIDPAPMPPMGLGGMMMGGFGRAELTPEQQRLRDRQLEVGRLELERNGYVFQEALGSGLGLKPFSYFVAQIPVPAMGLSMANVMSVHAQMPTSLLGMAQAHGASTPEQQREFFGLVELINGERLEKAREEALARMRELAVRSGGDPAAVESAARRHPEHVPLDHRKWTLLVPDMVYTPIGGQVLRLDEHDWSTAQAWLDPATGRVNTGRDAEGHPDGRMGQFFHLGGKNAILMRDFQIDSTTPLHELGHALDFLLERLAPDWHGGWLERVAAGFDRVGTENGPQAITAYSRTNLREYVGDGFRVYFSDREALRTKDPDLLARVEELLGKAREMHGAQPGQQATLGAILTELSRRGA